MNKRGFVEIQFNWIFILIAGVVLLGFFIGMSGWIKSLNEEQLTVDILDRLGFILTGAEVSEDSASLIDVPDSKMVFSCDGGDGECNELGCPSSFMFDDYPGNYLDTSVNVLFTLESLKSTQLVTWSLDWNVPYRVMNFLYLTTTEVKYVIVYSDASRKFATKVYNELDNNNHLSKNLLFTPKADLNKIRYKNEDHVRFVFFEDPAVAGGYQLDSSMENRDNVDYVVIDYNPLDESLGKVKYGKLNGGSFNTDTESFPYLGMPSVIGAIFSGDLSMYKCNMKKAVNRLRKVNKLYWGLSERYADYYKNDFVCKGFYDSDLMGHFDYIDQISTLTAAEPDFEQFVNAFEPPTRLIEAINEIEQDNVDLLKTSPSINTRKPCPMIY